MSATYSIDPRQRLVRTEVRGIANSPELLGMYARMVADPLFSSSYDQLADWRNVTEIEVMTDAVRDAARSHPFNPGTRRAVVVSSDLVYGMVRVFAGYSEHVGQDVRVFRDMTQAEQWLGLTSD